MKSYVHKPTVLSKELEDPRIPLIEDMAISLKWLTEHDRQCRQCINAAIKILYRIQEQIAFPTTDERLHWTWMCPECQEALDAELQSNFDGCIEILEKAVRKSASKQEKGDREALYHVCRLAYTLGKNRPWYQVVHIIRHGLKMFTVPGDRDPVIRSETERELIKKLRELVG